MRKLTFCLILSFSFSFSRAQTSAQAGVGFNSPDTNRIDTSFIQVYKDKLILALWQSERSFDIHIAQKLIADSGKSEVNYIANSNHVTGISLDYDIIGFAFGYRSVPVGNARTGNTDYMDLGLNINTRRLRIENGFRRYTGFYDKRTGQYTIPFNDTVPYFKNPSLTVKTMKSKLIYVFKNKKFALGAAYANVRRQLRSSGSWILVGNFYGMQMYADSLIIPPPLHTYYGMIWDGLRRMNIYAFSAGGGYTQSLVIWKKICLNVLISVGLERQYRHYYIQPENVHYSYWKTWVAADWRTSVGYNGKRFFIRATNVIDLTNYTSDAMDFKMQFIAGSFDFGYRFNFKAPKPYKKFQESKVYKML